MMNKTILAILTTLMTINVCHAKEEGQTVLLPKNATIEGTIVNYDGKHLGNWRQSEDLIKFNISGLEKGKYKIIVKYAAPDEFGGKISFKLNETEFRRTLGGTGGWGAPDKKTVGYFEHTGGAVNIALEIIKPNAKGEPVIDIYSITLEAK